MTFDTNIRNNRLFGILLLTTEATLIFMFGFFETYANHRFISDDHFLIAALLVLALSGFGLLTTYVRAVSSASWAQVIVMLGMGVQLYFLFFGFWEIIGLSGLKWVPRQNDDILPISLTNAHNDRQVSQMLQSSSMTDCIACLISLIVAYSAVIGRISNLQLYFFSVIGTFIYTFNSMIFWRLFITDAGYGMRIFLFGGVFGLFCSIVLGKKDTTVLHPRYNSNYYFQAFNLFGALVVWCLLPVLVWSDIWHMTTVGADNAILHVASLNMWFALCGSAIGSFCGCALVFKKLCVHTIIFTVFTGGIAFTSVSDVHLNPGVAIAIGVLSSLICSLALAKGKRSFNEDGVRDTNGVLFSYLIPGFIAGILSAIFQANGNNNNNGTYYIGNKDGLRTQLQQGGIQLAGVGIAAGLGLFAGLVSALLMKIFNRQSREEQFDSTFIVRQYKFSDEQKQNKMADPMPVGPPGFTNQQPITVPVVIPGAIPNTLPPGTQFIPTPQHPGQPNFLPQPQNQYNPIY